MAALQLPFFLLLQQLVSHKPHDCSVVWEDSDHFDDAFDLLIEPLERVVLYTLCQCS